MKEQEISITFPWPSKTDGFFCKALEYPVVPMKSDEGSRTTKGCVLTQPQAYVLRLSHCCLSDTNIKAYMKEKTVLKRKKGEIDFWTDKMIKFVYRQLNS